MTIETLPANLNAPEAREKVMAIIGRLSRQVAALGQGIADRERIIDGLKQDVISQRSRIEDLTERLEDAAAGGDSLAVRNLQAELARWRGVVEVAAGALVAMSVEAERALQSAPVEATLPPAPSPSRRGEEEAGDQKAVKPAKVAALKICAVPWCNDAKLAHGLCPTHYSRERTNGDPYLVRLRVTGSRETVLHREVDEGEFVPVVTAAGEPQTFDEVTA